MSVQPAGSTGRRPVLAVPGNGGTRRASGTALLFGPFAILAVASSLAGARPLRILAAAGLVYVMGYGTGALLLSPKHDRTSLSAAMVRLTAGLLLTTIAFLLSLLLSLPWLAGPACLSLVALLIYRQSALAVPRISWTFSRDGAVAGLIAGVLLAPIAIAALRMAPGQFPPVFFNVDTPYFLEKVHVLVQTQMYPPESLSFVDGRRPYHFGVHGLTALISRASGVAPHHSLFLIVLPLLTCSVLASAVFFARSVAPALPLSIAVPMMLVSIPTLWYPFWNEAAQLLRQAASTWTLAPLERLAGNYELWGVASNNGQNVAAHFLVVTSLAGIFAAPSIGWRLPVFLIGSAIIFKASTGVALAAGFCLAQAYRAAVSRSIRPLMPAAAVTAVFGAVYGVFWILPPIPAEFTTDVFPLFHLRFVHQHGGLLMFAADVAWLLVPALLVLPATPRSGTAGVPLLVFALAPFIVVNTLRSIDLRPGFGVDDDWLQIVLPVPLVLHAFAVSVVARRWAGLGAGLRAAVWLSVALIVVPPALVAARYSHLLIRDPERGHEFVDNRPLGRALAAIPIAHTLIVTNDLRYPAEGFSRDNRQMQIPALFGHQGFALNYAYEAYAFSRDRMELQKLLRAEEWSPAIEEAARTHRWTHFVVRKDYPHPDPIPLERIFDNGPYSVYRFDGS